MSKTTKRIVLLDTHAIIHRAYHALPDFRAKDGTPTGALYGLSNMLSSIIRDLKPDYIFACYDLPGKTFRHDAYEDYKGTRQKGDDDLIAQLISSREIIDGLNIPIYDAPGYEADDVIGTIAKKFAHKDNYDIIIASGDMDTMQLIEGEHVRVFTLKKGITDTVLIDEEAVIERFGFKPEFIPDYKGLRGDTSDNIPGIRGIGEKTGMLLISKFNTIENLYKVLKTDPEKVKGDGITERIFNLIKEGEDDAVFSKMLAQIRYDAPVKIEIPENTWSESFDKQKAENVFNKFEFKNMLNRFDPNYVKPQTQKAFKLKDKNGDKTNDKSTKSKKNNDDNLAYQGQEITDTEFSEAQIMLWLLNSEKTNPKLEDIFEYTNEENFKDAYSELYKSISKEKKLLWLYENVEKKLIGITNEMTNHGIKVNRKYLKELSEKIYHDVQTLEKEIVDLAGTSFNVNSPKQLSQVLFEKIGLPTKGLKKRKDGLYSTDVDTLNKFTDVHPIINKMLEYRELEKLRSTYIDVYGDMLDGEDKLHPTFVLTGSATGRFSSVNPNVQNIPIKGSRGKEMRNIFIAQDGYTLMAFDYSQIELRIVAILSQDPSLIEIFNNGYDIHTEVAKKVYNVEGENVTKDMRRHAKVINFGILYGMGATALSKEMGISRNDAKSFIDTYFSRFPRLAQYIEEVLNSAKKIGYTETLYGRRRYIPNIKSKLPFLKAMAERMAGNAPIQGTAADIIRIALCEVEKELKNAGLINSVYPILQIHDELVFEVKDDAIDTAKNIIKKAMEKPIDIEFIGNLKSVPIIVESHIGKSFGNMV